MQQNVWVWTTDVHAHMYWLVLQASQRGCFSAPHVPLPTVCSFMGTQTQRQAMEVRPVPRLGWSPLRTRLAMYNFAPLIALADPGAAMGHAAQDNRGAAASVLARPMVGLPAPASGAQSRLFCAHLIPAPMTVLAARGRIGRGVLSAVRIRRLARASVPKARVWVAPAPIWGWFPAPPPSNAVWWGQVAAPTVVKATRLALSLEQWWESCF